jgi:inosine-uridine nucleoside N-ribohydrolase
VAEVVIMGGAATVNGNVNPAAEANIIHDPHAADIVFTAKWPVTMVGLDVTMLTEMSEAFLASLKTSRTGQFIFEISRFYQNFHQERHGLKGTHTHDPSAIAYLLDPQLFSTVQGPVRVITEGMAMGQTLLDRRKEGYDQTEWSNKPDVNVCVGVDSEGLRSMFKARITQAA